MQSQYVAEIFIVVLSAIALLVLLFAIASKGISKQQQNRLIALIVFFALLFIAAAYSVKIKNQQQLEEFRKVLNINN